MTRAPPSRAQQAIGLTPSTAASPAALETMPIDLPVDLGITIGGAALWATTQVMAPTLAPSTCRWCDRAPDGTDRLNSFDASVRSALRWSHPAIADTLSSVVAFGLAPLAAVGIGALGASHDDRLPEVPADALVVAESAVIAINVNQMSKFVFGRQRPDVHAHVSSDTSFQPSPEDNLSFFSGHATLAFALATSAGTVASMRHRRLAPFVWVAGLVLAATGSYLRIAADRHYATDVITGAVVGSAFGFGVPYFGHHPVGPCTGLAVLPTKGETSLVLSGAW